MTKYRFSAAERYAVYTVGGAKCYMCSTPVDLKSFQIDHVLPESLLDNPELFSKVREELGRPDDFAINSFENWQPACSACNNAKRQHPWEPSLLVQRVLQKAAREAPKAESLATETTTNRKVTGALLLLERVNEEGDLTDAMREALLPLVADYSRNAAPEAEHERLDLTPRISLPLLELLADDGLVQIARGPFGVGAGPSGRDRPVPAQMTCGVCGVPFFNGARCITCGAMDDD